MKDVVYNVVWWTLFAVLICFAAFDFDDLAFYWLSGFLIGAAIYRIFDKYLK
jgi:hypothetical protein